MTPGEWRGFLLTNREELKGLDAAFRYYYKYNEIFEPDNPIYNITSVESEIVSEDDIQLAYDNVLQVRARFMEVFDELSRWRARPLTAREIGYCHLYSIMVEGMQFSMEEQRGDDSFLGNLSRRSVDCDTGSLLHLIVGHTVGLPEYLVRVPNHAFLKYDDGRGDAINVDYANEMPDEVYMEAHGIDWETAKRSGFMIKLSGEDLVPVSLAARSIEKSRRGDIEGAISDCEEALRLRPDFAATHNTLGNIKADAKRHREAVEDFNRAIELYPNYARARYYRAFSHFMLGDSEKARADIDRALELSRSLPWEISRFSPNFIAGMIMFDTGDIPKARKHLVKSLGYLRDETRRDDMAMPASLTLYTLAALLVPDSYRLTTGLRHDLADPDRLDTRLGFDLGWTTFIGDSIFYLRPEAGVGYSTRVSHHMVELGGGFELGVEAGSNSAGLALSAGYNFRAAGDADSSAMGEGGFFGYSLNIHRMILDPFGAGVSLTMQHDISDPSKMALTPAFDMSLSF
ncbi:MAG: tetratricopeptide repeat protein [Proteobacteria bacterium]|nr:tetratricopeptide repeat protein [Pseudomonadota bacterium]